jgi:hypothetical protein
MDAGSDEYYGSDASHNGHRESHPSASLRSPIAPALGCSAWEEAPEPLPDWDLLGKHKAGVESNQRTAR